MRKFILSLMFILLALPAWAAVTANSVITAQTPNRGVVQFLQGTDVAGTYKTLYTGAANGSKIYGAYLTTSDATATHLVTCQVVNSTIKYGGTAVTTTLGAGFATGIPAINLLSSTTFPGLAIDSDGNPFIFLASGDTFACTFATALTAATVINIVTNASDF